MNSPEANIYCLSWYLNSIHPGWNALIIEQSGAYVFIMPLLVRKRGVATIHRKPVLAQQLGWFSSYPYGEILSKVFKLIKKEFSLFEYPLKNVRSFPVSQWSVSNKKNFILSLNTSYPNISGEYRRDRKARLKQSKRLNLRMNKSEKSDQLITLFEEYVAPKIFGGVDKPTLQSILTLIDNALSREAGFLCHVTNESNDIVSSAFFLIFKNRLIYTFSATTAEGLRTNANTFLIDSVIREYANTNYVFDFKGSDVPGIADFYLSFGATQETYQVLDYKSGWAKAYIRLRKALSKK